MKKFFAIAAVAAISMGSLAYGQTVLEDFESGTDGGALASQWLPHYSGSTSGIDLVSDTAIYSAEQDNTSGTGLSGKISFEWTGASGGAIRIQPPVETVNADHSAESFISFAIYGNNSGDEFQMYMYDSNPNYEAAVSVVTIDFTGWQQYSWDIDTETFVGWITGDGTIASNDCRWSGLFFRQGSAAAALDYYLDDIQYSATAIGTDMTAVQDWSVY